MLIYGTKLTEIATENLSDKCPHCGTANSLQLSVYQKYAHVFWIPFFPSGKTGATECSHCKQVLQHKEFGSNVAATYETIKSQAKTPLWTFSGLVLLAALIVFGVISSKQNNAKNAELISTPQKGDVYEIKLDYKQYTLYKVDDVVGDSVFLRVHQYETDKRTGIADLKKKGDEAYAEDILPMVKTDLKSMLDKGEIMDVERK